MVMITGGAFQGKTAYAVRSFGISNDEIVDGKTCDIDAVRTARCIKNYHELVRRLGTDCERFTAELCCRSPDIIVIMDEIGCGIIPIEKSERVWRENVGRCGSIIAAHSEIVVRMVCGIPTVLKGNIS